MRKMPDMRRPPRASISPTARAALIGLVLGGVLVAAGRPARAQTTAPTSPPSTSTSAPQAEPTPPPAALPSPPPGPATPPLEAGDTAPPGAPIQPLAAPSSTAAAPPGLPPSAIAQESLGSVPPRETRPRVYETRWFWGAVGVVVITVAVVLVLSLNTSGPSTPSTTLGDMRAF
jgi:hypothetical protein